MPHLHNWTARPLPNGRMAVTRYLGKSPIAAVPPELDGRPVTHVAAGCFSDWTPDHTDDELTVLLPSTLLTVDPRAFDACPYLTEFAVEPENPFFTAREGLLYDKAEQTLIRYPQGLGGWYIELPATVTDIGPRAFAGSAIRAFVPANDPTALGQMSGWRPAGTRVLHGGSLRSIGRLAFDNCRGLRLVGLRPSLDRLDFGAFRGCSALYSLCLPEGIVRLEGQTFHGCGSLQSLCLPASLARLERSDIDGCHALRQLFFRSPDTELSLEGFRPHRQLCILAPSGSAAAHYAADHSLPFQALPAEPPAPVHA